MVSGSGDLFDGPAGPTWVEPSCVHGGGSIVGGNGHARFIDRLPGLVPDQRGSFAGGCERFLTADEEDLDAGQCSDLQVAVSLAPETGS